MGARAPLYELHSVTSFILSAQRAGERVGERAEKQQLQRATVTTVMSSYSNLQRELSCYKVAVEAVSAAVIAKSVFKTSSVSLCRVIRFGQSIAQKIANPQ